jgi:hypothetical protein
MSSRTHIWRASALALGLACIASRPAQAQRAQSVEIAVFGGGYFGSQIYQGTSGSPQSAYTVTVGSTGEYGARLGLNVSRQFGVEFSWSAADPSLNFSGYNVGLGKPAGSLSVNNFDFDAMFNFGQQRIWGYFAIGLGWSSFNPSVTLDGVPQAVNSQSYLSGNTALGMKVFVNPHIALQFDARYRWSNTNHNTSTGVGCVYYCYAYSSTYYGSGELSGGLTYVAFK